MQSVWIRLGNWLDVREDKFEFDKIVILLTDIKILGGGFFVVTRDE